MPSPLKIFVHTLNAQFNLAADIIPSGWGTDDLETKGKQLVWKLASQDCRKLQRHQSSMSISSMVFMLSFPPGPLFAVAHVAYPVDSWNPPKDRNYHYPHFYSKRNIDENRSRVYR